MLLVKVYHRVLPNSNLPFQEKNNYSLFWKTKENKGHKTPSLEIGFRYAQQCFLLFRTLHLEKSTEGEGDKNHQTPDLGVQTRVIGRYSSNHTVSCHLSHTEVKGTWGVLLILFSIKGKSQGHWHPGLKLSLSSHQVSWGESFGKMWFWNHGPWPQLPRVILWGRNLTPRFSRCLPRTLPKGLFEF